MIEILLARQDPCAWDILRECRRGIVLVVAKTGFHLRAQWTDETDVVVGSAPWREIFGIDVARIFK